MKILLSAYACHPNKGSEPGVGWNWLREISKYHEVWAFIYAEQGQTEAIQEEIQKLPQQSKIHIIPISVPTYFQTHLYRVRYEIWQWRAYQIAKKLIKKNKIDLIHHVTLATWWNCGHLWKLEIPFIFGPISGAQRIPSSGYPFLNWKSQFYERMRNAIFDVSWKYWIRFRGAIRNSTHIFCANEETLCKVKQLRDDNNSSLFTEVGISQLNLPRKRKNLNQFKLLWVGNIIPLKNLNFFLLVLNNLPKSLNWYLRIAGEGKLLNKLKDKVFEFSLDKRITFLGKIDPTKMKEEYDQADVFAFTSLREATGTVLLEAMSHGLPIVAFKMNGAKIVLDDNCAILINTENKEQMINDFTNAIIRLAKDPELRMKMGAAGRKRVEDHFLWEKRGIMMNEYYQNLIKNE